MKKVKCLLRLHGSYREIHLNFDSIAEAKRYVKECWDKPYTIVKLKENKEELFYFDDWVNDMLNNSDYTESELMEFEEHYQNLLNYDQNTENFINHFFPNIKN